MKSTVPPENSTPVKPAVAAENLAVLKLTTLPENTAFVKSTVPLEKLAPSKSRPRT